MYTDVLEKCATFLDHPIDSRCWIREVWEHSHSNYNTSQRLENCNFHSSSTTNYQISAGSQNFLLHEAGIILLKLRCSVHKTR